MTSLKSKLNFNKLRNKKDKIKNRLKRKDKPPKEAKEKKPKNKKVIWYRVLTIITGLAIIAFVVIILFAAYIVISAPEFTEEKLFNKDSTVIYYGTDNKVLTTLGMSAGNGEVENRVKVEYDELPEVLIDAVVATEDSRFFQHNGVDLARFIKASLGQLVGQSGAGGASTLTMQVSKNALTDTTSTGIKGIVRKFTDIYLSVFKIEKKYTKQDIIALYLNSEFLGNHSFGVEKASQTYFGKSVKDLTLPEAALIAGLFQAPSAYDPFNYPEEAEARRNQVLNLMVRHGYISEDEASIAKQIHVKDMIIERKSYISEYQGYIDTVIQEVKDKYKVDPYKVPLEIYTYFDPDKQNVVNSVYDGSSGYEFKDEKVQLGMVVLNNSDGSMVAVGSRRNHDGEMQFNYATSINRHPGSIIKPILDYGPAIEYLNWNTYTPLFDEETPYNKGGVIKNWNGKYDGLVTLKTGLSKSLNTTALQAFHATTNDQKWKFSTSLGVTPGNSDGKIFESASIGAFEGTNPKQMAGAYAAFANGGYYTEPHSVKSIKYIESGETEEIKYTKTRVMKETTAYLITNVLFNVTPYASTVRGTQVATKTGTSSYDESRLRQEGISLDAIQDSWVVTYNPDYTIAFWNAYDELDKEYYYKMYQSTNHRNKIQSIVTKKIFNTGSKFTIPKGLVQRKVELETIPARLASEYTPEKLKETHYFIAGTEPTETSTRFSKLSDVTDLKVIETGTSARLSWTGISVPQAVDTTYLTDYFNTNFNSWAEKNYNLRIEYNKANIGEFGYDIYLQSGNNLNYVGTTKDTTYTINNTTNYDSVVVKSAYSIFKANQSNGTSETLKGSTTEFNIELEAVSTPNGNYVHPTYKVGDTIPDMGLKTIKFLIDKKDATDTLSGSDIKYEIKDCTTTCTKVDKIDSSKVSEYEITYSVNYLGSIHTEIRYVHIKGDSE